MTWEVVRLYRQANHSSCLARRCELFGYSGLATALRERTQLLRVQARKLLGAGRCDGCKGSRRIVTNLDGDALCQSCADKWVRAEGDYQAYLESES